MRDHFDLTPRGIIKHLQLLKPIYKTTARHGHFGRSICGVVYEGADSSGCQFSFACNGELVQRKSPVALRRRNSVS